MVQTTHDLEGRFATREAAGGSQRDPLGFNGSAHCRSRREEQPMLRDDDPDFPVPEDAEGFIESLLNDTRHIIELCGPEEAYCRVLGFAARFRDGLVEQFGFTIEQAENVAEAYLSRASD